MAKDTIIRVNQKRILLWANNDPIGETDVSLSDGDYDMLEIHSVTETTSTAPYIVQFAGTGRDVQLSFAQIATDGNLYNSFLLSRKFVYQSQSLFRLTNANMLRFGRSDAQTTFNPILETGYNYLLIPIRIYGIKNLNGT